MSKTFTIPENEILRFYRNQNALADPALIELSQLDIDMTNILNQTHLSPSQKAWQYYTILKRYKNLYAHLARESGDDTPIFSPPPPLTSTVDAKNILSSSPIKSQQKESTKIDDEPSPIKIPRKDSTLGDEEFESLEGENLSDDQTIQPVHSTPQATRISTDTFISNVTNEAFKKGWIIHADSGRVKIENPSGNIVMEVNKTNWTKSLKYLSEAEKKLAIPPGVNRSTITDVAHFINALDFISPSEHRHLYPNYFDILSQSDNRERTSSLSELNTRVGSGISLGRINFNSWNSKI